MLWVYGHEKYFSSYSAGIDFSRHNLTQTQTSFIWFIQQKYDTY